jgi:glyoxylase-like metal-dependent hydrolase (beta-lactamase superfamily II)
MISHETDRGPVGEPSDLATQPIGDAAPVADGVWQLKLPVPFPLHFVSAYLVEGGDGWTLIDAGYDYPPARAAWETGSTAVGCDLARDVERIVVTHFHPDHIGAARWLGEKTGAPVFMMEREIRFARKIWGSSDAGPFLEYLTRNGMPEEAAGSAAAVMRYALPLPEEMFPLRPGETLTMGESTVRIIHVPGHADNQIVLHDEARGILFAADHLLLGITPNIGLWPEAEPHPLARYLESLENTRGLGADLVLPGHGPVFHDLNGRIGELLFHHEERLETMRRAVSDHPKTAYEVSRIVFRGTLTEHQRCFALAETLAHLDHLVLEGRAQRIENETEFFRAS